MVRNAPLFNSFSAMNTGTTATPHQAQGRRAGGRADIGRIAGHRMCSFDRSICVGTLSGLPGHRL
jgi:hypothetical protein